MFETKWITEAKQKYEQLRAAAKRSLDKRQRNKGTKSSKVEGLFKQVHKAIEFLKSNPKHSGLQTHEFHSLQHPYSPSEKVFEAYVQNNTPGAYRVLWCYGPASCARHAIVITRSTPS